LRASEHHQAAIKIQEAIRQRAPTDESNLHHLAGSYNNLSALYLPAQSDVAQRFVERALTLQIALVRQNPTERNYESDLALTYNNLGAIHARQSRLKDAELCYRDAITIRQRLVAVSPLVTSYRRDLAVSLNNLGMTQTKTNALADAATSFNKALEIQKDLVAGQTDDVNLLSALGGIYNNLGLLQQQQSQCAEAAESFELAIAAQKKAHERAPTALRYREFLSRHYVNYAAVLRTLDRPADAAVVTLARRDLWPGDSQQLQQIATELAEISSEIPAGDQRQQFVHEVAQTRTAAARASSSEQLKKSVTPQAVLFHDPVE
jgi:tetratricopeptide (TPR) repeat protein